MRPTPTSLLTRCLKVAATLLLASVSPRSCHAAYSCLDQIVSHFCAYPAHSRCAKAGLLDARTAVLVMLNALDIANK